MCDPRTPTYHGTFGVDARTLAHAVRQGPVALTNPVGFDALFFPAQQGRVLTLRWRGHGGRPRPELCV